MAQQCSAHSTWLFKTIDLFREWRDQGKLRIYDIYICRSKHGAGGFIAGALFLCVIEYRSRDRSYACGPTSLHWTSRFVPRLCRFNAFSTDYAPFAAHGRVLSAAFNRMDFYESKTPRSSVGLRLGPHRDIGIRTNDWKRARRRDLEGRPIASAVFSHTTGHASISALPSRWWRTSNHRHLAAPNQLRTAR